MPIRVVCSCGKVLQAKDALAGRQAKCPACGQPVRVPQPAQEERSESGSPIWRHAERTKPFEPAFGSENLEHIDQHIERHLGQPAMVFHELVSDLVHVDVHHIEPTPERDFHTLVTSGMSDRPMAPPEGAEECQYAELMLCLPPDWPLDMEAFQDERNYWPVRWLKILARLPHEYDTWLWWGHTVPNGDPPEPVADNTKFCCMLLLSPLLVPQEFAELEIDDEKTVHFFSAVPIYREEMEVKMKEGADALVDRFMKYEITELVDVDRKNVAKKKFGLF